MRRRRMFGLLGGGLILLAASVFGCAGAKDEWPEGKSPRIMTTFPPLYCFAANVAGDEAAVKSLLTRLGPHDYAATHGDVKKLLGADLFLVNGLSLDETFSQALLKSSGNTQARYVEVGAAVANLAKMPPHEHHHHGPGQHHHHHGEFDPHVWLGIPEAVQMVRRIRDELKAIDPGNAARYEQNAAAYVARLEKLHEDGKAAFQGKKNRRLITFHESLAYFARSFGLEIVDSIQARPGEEPSSAKLAKLVEVCRAKPVGAITLEPQYPDNTAARTLRNELKAKGIGDVAAVVVDPLETVGDDRDLRPDWYETMMRKNIDTLAKALP
jgi:zinc transport system substrate-binding protein